MGIPAGREARRSEGIRSVGIRSVGIASVGIRSVGNSLPALEAAVPIKSPKPPPPVKPEITELIVDIKDDCSLD